MREALAGGARDRLRRVAIDKHPERLRPRLARRLDRREAATNAGSLQVRDEGGLQIRRQCRDLQVETEWFGPQCRQELDHGAGNELRILSAAGE
jgi:hypothetical protein